MHTKLTPQELKTLPIKTLKENQTLFYEGSLCQHLGIVTKGELIIISYSVAGKEIIYSRIKPGESFGGNLILSENRKYKGNVIALKDSEVLLINRNEFLNLLKTNEDFLVDYLKKQADKTKNLNYELKLLSFDNAADRLMYALNKSGELEFKTVTELSSRLHLSREATSRLLSKLIKEHVITRTSDGIAKS